MNSDYFEPEIVSLKTHARFTERWLQDRIAENPKILGLGDLVLRDRERMQPYAGRLDLLLQDPDTLRRYEVEIQLGRTDETHIIRTLEYWDIERKRYPQYEHCAVIIAEEITSRFLNVIALFNGYIPLIAIKLQAIRMGEKVGLIFTKVLDEVQLGLIEEDEEVQEPADRHYWEEKGSPKSVAMVDHLLKVIHEFAPTYELKYNRHYIGLAENGRPNNFVFFRPQKSTLRLSIKLPKTDETTEAFENAGLDTTHDRGSYRIRLNPDELDKHAELLRTTMQRAYTGDG